MAALAKPSSIFNLSSRLSVPYRQGSTLRLRPVGSSGRAAVTGIVQQHDNTLSSSQRRSYQRQSGSENSSRHFAKYAALGAASLGAGFLCYLTSKQANRQTPTATVQCQKSPDAIKAGQRNGKFKDIRREDVRAHTSKDKGGIWVTFNEGVYDITDFLDGHPGGEKILLAAGGSLEPFWQMYSVHKNPQVYEILEEMRIGNIHPDDLKDEDDAPDLADPFARDPKRHPALKVNSAKPFNAETPVQLLTDNFHTPNELFFVRNHLPVPHVDPKDFRLELKVPGRRRSIKLSVEELRKKFKVHTISAAVQCAGNRRSHMAAESRPVKGLSWGMTAISNAEWTGVKLADVLEWAGVNENEFEHVIFQGEDIDMEGHPYEASIPAATAFDPRRDVLIAFKMNGVDIPLDHGYPLRLVVPGSVGARQVKWLGKIIPSKIESQSHHQQKDYKTFTPSIDWATADFSKAVAIQDYPLQSAITEPLEGATIDGEEVTVKGYAWSGGGRGIIRVEVSADGGKTWHEAQLHTAHQKYNRVWAWTLWEATVQVPEGAKEARLMCKAIDSSHNQQPESAESIWNMRGLIHNAWHKVKVNVSQE